MKRIALPLLLIGSLLLAACGGPPAENPMLLDAQMAYREVKDDANLLATAPEDLQAAESALARSQALWRDNADQEEIDHYAYLAMQRVNIAKERAALRNAEKAIEKAELTRKEVQLQARTLEAELAEDRARTSQRDAEQARALAERESREAQTAKAEAEQAQRAAALAIAQAQALAERVAELEALETERGLVLTLSDVLFDVDRATLKPGGLRAADEIASFLKEYPKRNVLIEGFTDNTGSEGYNLNLSQRRADAVRMALMERGIASDRIQIKGYGESYPVASNGTAAGRQQNRRVEIIISDQRGIIPARSAETMSSN